MVKVFKLGHHPYLCGKYINGYIKDVPLRNYNEEEIIANI